jgi:hypothetical protein
MESVSARTSFLRIVPESPAAAIGNENSLDGWIVPHLRRAKYSPTQSAAFLFHWLSAFTIARPQKKPSHGD